MLKLKTTLISLLAIGVAFVFCACQIPKQDSDTPLLSKIKQRGYLIVGSSYSAPPQAFLNKKGRPEGLDIDLAKMLAKDIVGDSEKIKFVDLPNPSRLSAINSGQVDIILGSFSYTKAREKYYDFSKPYMISAFRVIVKKDSGIQSVKDLSGKKVTFIFGGTSEGILKKSAPIDIVMVGYNSLADEARAFALNEVDAFANQEGPLLSYMKKTCGNVMLPEKLDEAKYVVGYTKNPNADSLEKKVQALLDAYEKNGTINQLKEKWLNIPDYVPCR